MKETKGLKEILYLINSVIYTQVRVIISISND